MLNHLQLGNTQNSSHFLTETSQILGSTFIEELRYHIKHRKLINNLRGVDLSDAQQTLLNHSYLETKGVFRLRAPCSPETQSTDLAKRGLHELNPRETTDC
jgi:hypothetical protein